MNKKNEAPEIIKLTKTPLEARINKRKKELIEEIFSKSGIPPSLITPTKFNYPKENK